MIGHPYHHPGQHPHHLRRVLIFALIALLAYLLISDTAEAGPFPPFIDMGTLDGTDGFILNGVDSDDESGYSVSGAGDVNGDGIDDLIIGAYFAFPNGQPVAGESYVVFGRTTGFPATFELRSLFPAAGGDGSQGFVLKGIDSDDRSGYSVSGAGDINGDGIADLIIGADRANPNGRSWAGESYVVFGRMTGFPALFELRSLHPALGGDGSQGFILRGALADDRSGTSVGAAGDVNGDGIDDLIIGAPGFQGRAYVVFGRTTGFPPLFELFSLFTAAGGEGSQGFVLKGFGNSPWYSSLGTSVSRAGDVNGDGIADLLLGAPHANRGGEQWSGETYVVFGRTTGFPAELELRELYPDLGGDGSEGFVLPGWIHWGESGHSVSGMGDVNGDAIDDIIIGAFNSDSNDEGNGYVVFGRSTGFPPVIELRNFLPGAGGDGSDGFVLRGVGDNLGRSVSVAGDINGDGIADVMIGANWANFDGMSPEGGTYIVYGRATGFPAAFDLSVLDPANGGDGSEGFILAGGDDDAQSGWSVSYPGDVNGDGIDDLIIGGPEANPDGRSDAGQSYVVFGRVNETR